jgi:hypothetical protein
LGVIRKPSGITLGLSIPIDDQPKGYESSIDNVVLGTTKVRCSPLILLKPITKGKVEENSAKKPKAYLKQLLPEGTKVKVIPGKQAKKVARLYPKRCHGCQPRYDSSR